MFNAYHVNGQTFIDNTFFIMYKFQSNTFCVVFLQSRVEFDHRCVAQETPSRQSWSAPRLTPNN